MKAAVLASLLYTLASTLARLPWRWQHRAGDALGWWWMRLDVRETRVVRRNLDLAFSDLSAAERQRLNAEVMRTTARQTLETLRFWTRPHGDNLAHITEHHGTALLDAALASGRGVLIAAPHYGNWELLNQWLAWRTPLAILYKPPQSGVGDAFLRRARAAEDTARVTQVRAEGAGIRQLFTLLRAGGVVGILPDQQPKAGDGEFAPFFGVQALTMTLLGRLAARSGAQVLFAYCERLGDGPAFALHIEVADADVASDDRALAAAALNADVERIARRHPSQYQWTYKRYSRRPPDSGEYNPYRDVGLAR